MELNEVVFAANMAKTNVRFFKKKPLILAKEGKVLYVMARIVVCTFLISKISKNSFEISWCCHSLSKTQNSFSNNLSPFIMKILQRHPMNSQTGWTLCTKGYQKSQQDCSCLKVLFIQKTLNKKKEFLNSSFYFRDLSFVFFKFYFVDLLFFNNMQIKTS